MKQTWFVSFKLQLTSWKQITKADLLYVFFLNRYICRFIFIMKSLRMISWWGLFKTICKKFRSIDRFLFSNWTEIWNYICFSECWMNPGPNWENVATGGFYRLREFSKNCESAYCTNAVTLQLRKRHCNTTHKKTNVHYTRTAFPIETRNLLFLFFWASW